MKNKLKKAKLSKKKAQFYKCQQFELSEFVEKVESKALLPDNVEEVTEQADLQKPESSHQQKSQQEIDSFIDSLEPIRPLRIEKKSAQPNGQGKENKIESFESGETNLEKEKAKESHPDIITYQKMIQLENERFLDSLEPIRPLRIRKKALLEPMEKPTEKPKTFSDSIREFFENLKSKHLNNEVVYRTYIDAR